MLTKDDIRTKVGIEPEELAANGHSPEPEEDRILSYQDILDAPDLPKKKVPVPQWKGSVVIGGLSREEFLRCKASATDAKDKLDESKFEKALLIAALDSPKLNIGTVNAFYKKDVGAVGVIIKAIMSHLGADADAIKSDATGNGDEPGDAV